MSAYEVEPDPNRRRRDVKRVEISTVAVRVKVIHVDGKQAGISVFRQLIEQELLDGSRGDLNGEPLGFVNYHPDRCADDYEHLHVVWLYGDQPRRSKVSRPLRQPITIVGERVAAAYLVERVMRGWRPEGSFFGPEIIMEFPDGRALLPIPDEVIQRWLYSAASEHFKKEVAALAASLSDLPAEFARLDIERQTQATRADFEARQMRWQELLCLPQLFIAA